MWFKLRKTRRKVAPFLTPLGAARVARSADWLKIDMWENPSFESSGSRQLVGTLRCALPYSPLTCTSTHVRSSLACLSSACISLGMLLKAKFTPAVSSVQSLTPPPPLSLSLSLSPACDQIREKESLPLNTTIRASKRKFAKFGGPGLQGSHSQHAVADSKEKNAELFPATSSCVHGVLWISSDVRRVAAHALGNYMLSDATFNLFTPCDILDETGTQKQNSDSVWVSLAALGSCQLHFDNVSWQCLLACRWFNLCFNKQQIFGRFPRKQTWPAVECCSSSAVDLRFCWSVPRSGAGSGWSLLLFCQKTNEERTWQKRKLLDCCIPVRLRTAGVNRACDCKRPSTYATQTIM